MFNHSYLFSSSRGSGLRKLLRCEEIFVKPGGKLFDLSKLALERLKHISSHKIVYIMAGIPDICSRNKNKLINYEENWFDMSKDKFSEIKTI